jgi:hypothetical protein
MGSPNRMHSQLAHPSPTWWADLSLIYTHRAYAHEATPQLRKASDDLYRPSRVGKRRFFLPLRHEAEQAH